MKEKRKTQSRKNATLPTGTEVAVPRDLNGIALDDNVLIVVATDPILLRQHTLVAVEEYRTGF